MEGALYATARDYLTFLSAIASGGAPLLDSLAWAGLVNAFYWVHPTNGAAGVLMAQIFPSDDPGVVATFKEIDQAAYA